MMKGQSNRIKSNC